MTDATSPVLIVAVFLPMRKAYTRFEPGRAIVKLLRRTAAVMVVSVVMVIVPVAPVWAQPVVDAAQSHDGSPMLSFLSWWAAASIVVCSGISAIVMHKNYQVH